MGYPQEISVGALVRTSNAFDTAEVLTAAAAVYGAYCAHQAFSVSGFSFHISTAVNDLTASVIRLTKVTQGNVTSAITSMTIPNGAAVRKLYRKSFAPVQILSGDLLQFEHLTQGGLGGTPAGAGFYGFWGQIDHESAGNETNATVL